MGRPAGKRVPRELSLQRLLALLERVALAGEPCPTNTAIGAELGWDQSYPSELISTLEMQGLIAVRRDGQYRSVTILAEGKAKGCSTAMRGQFRRMHHRVDWAARRVNQAEGTSAPMAVPFDQLVARDPCPRCGVRGDVGCRHRAPVEPWRL